MDTSKIIKGVVGGGRYTVTAPIIKEDYGLYLQIEGLELPATYEVDFSNDEHSGSSVTMIGNSDGVLIPNQFISSGKDVFAFLYHVGEDFGRTVYKFRIPNKLRPDRTDETPTPEEQSVIDQTIAALNEAVEDAQEAQQAIEDMSVSATTLAEGASATVTKTEQDGVVHLEFGIPKGQTGDTPTITASKTGKTTSIYVDGSEVAQVEDGTDGTDGTSPTASVSKTGKTATITITDKNGTTSAQVEDGEDGATGVTPNLTIGTVETLEPTESATATITGTPENPVLNLGIPQGEQGEVTTEEFLKAFVTDSASGSIASFPDGADNIPLKSLVVDINPVQDLSNGDPSPDNICPISGWTGMDIQHTKKNLLPLNIWDGIPYNGSTGRVLVPVMTDKSWTQENDRITYNTTASYTALSLMTPLLPKGTYRLSIHKLSSGPVRYSRYALDKDFTIKFSTYSSSMTNISVDFTLDEDGYIAIRLDNGSTASQTVELTIQVEVGDTETAYKPYNGTTIPITFGQTVYSGKLDVLSGILTVYPEYDSYNGETLTGRWISDRDVYAVGTTPTIGAQVVNIGAQGTEYQLEPHEIASLLGTNNIFADTKLYIEKLTQPEEDDMIADSAITSGQFFMVGNTLYRALTNIASGATITVGTNAQRVSLSDALNLVNA